MRTLAIFLFFAFVASACSSSSSPPDSTNDCITACNNDSQLQCTSITDCTIYCDAIEGVATSGNCVTQVNAFISCAKSAKACSSKSACSSQDTDFSSCAAVYCDANTTDTNCTQLFNSL